MSPFYSHNPLQAEEPETISWQEFTSPPDEDLLQAARNIIAILQPRAAGTPRLVKALAFAEEKLARPYVLYDRRQVFARAQKELNRREKGETAELVTAIGWTIKLVRILTKEPDKQATRGRLNGAARVRINHIAALFKQLGIASA